MEYHQASFEKVKKVLSDALMPTTEAQIRHDFRILFVADLG